MDYQDINAQTIDRWIREGWEWGKPISHEVYEKAVNGEWDVYLTPTKTVPHEWFGSLKGKKILGLASGAGQQMHSMKTQTERDVCTSCIYRRFLLCDPENRWYDPGLKKRAQNVGC